MIDNNLNPEVAFERLSMQALQHLGVEQHLQTRLFGELQYRFVQRLRRDMEGYKRLPDRTADCLRGL